MEIVSHESGVAVFSAVADEVAPLKGIYLPAILRRAQERYETASIPTVDEAKKDGAVFNGGRLLIDGGRQINIKELRIYDDGVGAVTTDTDDSDAVVRDVWAWLKDEFQFRDSVTPPTLSFRSDLVVRFDNDIAETIESLMAPILDFVKSNADNSQNRLPIQFARLTFSSDPTRAGLMTDFTIERRARQPWRLGLFFSHASLRSAAHVEALRQFDVYVGEVKTSATASEQPS